MLSGNGRLINGYYKRCMPIVNFQWALIYWERCFTESRGTNTAWCILGVLESGLNYIFVDSISLFHKWNSFVCSSHSATLGFWVISIPILKSLLKRTYCLILNIYFISFCWVLPHVHYFYHSQDGAYLAGLCYAKFDWFLVN